MGFISSTILNVYKSDVFLYCIVFNFYILINKYVLSVVGFKFPAVFQGWQALVSSIYLLNVKRNVSTSPSFSGPHHVAIDALLFVIVIILSSKSLAAVPVPLFLSVQNVPMLCYLILSLHKVPLTEFFIAVTGLASSLCLFIFKDENVSDDGLFWLIWYCIAYMLFEIYFQSDGSSSKEVVKNFYRNFVSVIVLLIWTMVTDEGRSASEFSSNESTRFAVAFLCSGILSAVINGLAPRSRLAQGFGVDQLRDRQLDTYWQSDGQLPHLVSIQFSRKMTVTDVSIYMDFKLDESYTPNRLSIRAGSSFNDLQEIELLELGEPSGWVTVPLKDTRGERKLRTFLLQVAVLSNHQNGRDCHIRQMLVHSPAEVKSLALTPVPGYNHNFTTYEFLQHTTLR